MENSLRHPAELVFTKINIVSKHDMKSKYFFLSQIEIKNIKYIINLIAKQKTYSKAVQLREYK